jgi:hypothetical protein
MGIFDFEPINCRTCGKLIWSGHSSSGFFTKLDIARLNVGEEIVKRIEGLNTYRLHKTIISFEAVWRNYWQIAENNNHKVVVLAEHTCSTFELFETPPNYWPERIKVPAKVNHQEEGFPF